MKILVAGIGNIFMGDDAFGVEVVRRLSSEPVPQGVRIEDFGIRSYDLAFAIMDGYDVTVLVDAAPRGEEAGTVSLIEVDPGRIESAEGPILDPHAMNPVVTLQMVKSLGGVPGRLYVVACEPSVIEAEDIALSEPVRAAVPEAVAMVQRLIRDVLAGNEPTKLAPCAARGGDLDVSLKDQ
jgi:hydrogenase maturation protease